MIHGPENTSAAISEMSGIPRPELAGAIQGAMIRFARDGHELDFQQEEALQAIGMALLDGDDTGYVEMATSSGKTVVEAILADAGVAAGLRVLQLAPTKAIADQLAGIDVTKGMGGFTTLRDRVEVREHYGTRRGNKTARVVTTTYDGFLNDFKNNHAKLGRFDVILADENHRSLGPQISHAMTQAFPGAVKLGFSATPDYGVNRTSEEIYGKKLYEFSLVSAIESGRTAPVRALLYETDQALEVIDYQNEFTEKELAPLIANRERNAAALKFVEDFVESGRQGFVACLPGSNNLHARIMSDLISQMPTKSGRTIRAADIGGHLSDDEIRHRLKQFKAGEIDVLTATRMLDEGVDISQLKFGINMVPSTSPVRIKQLFGRLLRQDGRNTEAVFVDFVDRKTGIAKGQYTALHALDLLDFDMTRVIGEGSVRARGLDKVESHYVFGADVYAMLQKSQGKTLQDIVMPRNTSSAFNALLSKWNRTLAAEGLPEELPYNLAFDARLETRVNAARLALRQELRREPTLQELMDNFTTTQGRLDMIRHYGIRVPMDNLIEVVEGEEDVPHEKAAFAALCKQLARVLSTVGDRAERVIKMRYGLDDGTPKSLDEIARVDGGSRERMRQIESKTISQLRHPSRSNVLRGYIYEEAPISNENNLQDREIEHPKTIQESYDNYTRAFERQLHAYVSEHGISGLSQLIESGDHDAMFALVDVAWSTEMSKNMRGIGYTINAVEALRPYLQARLAQSGLENNPYTPDSSQSRIQRKIVRQLGLKLLDELERNRSREANNVPIRK